MILWGKWIEVSREFIVSKDKWKPIACTCRNFRVYYNYILLVKYILLLLLFSGNRRFMSTIINIARTNWHESLECTDIILYSKNPCSVIFAHLLFHIHCRVTSFNVPEYIHNIMYRILNNIPHKYVFKIYEVKILNTRWYRSNTVL